MTTFWFSLRRRLLALLLGGVSIAWLATVVFSYIDAHHEVDELFDAQLAQTAQALLVLAASGNTASVIETGPAAHKYQRNLRFQIWQADGKLVLHSNNAPNHPLTDQDGFSETTSEWGYGGPGALKGHWRHFSQWNPAHTLQVQVSEDHVIRDELIGHIAWRLLLPALFGLPIMGLWVWVATRRSLSSLDDIAEQITARNLQRLQPVAPTSAPLEIRPLLEALNDLFQRVERALEGERRFTADAAHELRTPLAALQAQLQVAQRARTADERESSLQQLQRGLERASHLVSQMLQLARLEPESGIPQPESVNLTRTVEEICADLGTDILDKHLEFDCQAPPEAPISGHREWLQILIRNLIDNAIRYTPPQGKLRVRINQLADLVTLEIADSGPGIPPEQRLNALKRFHRLHGNDQPGSGLGLAIAQQICILHNTRLILEQADLGGLLVRIDFHPQQISR